MRRNADSPLHSNVRALANSAAVACQTSTGRAKDPGTSSANEMGIRFRSAWIQARHRFWVLGWRILTLTGQPRKMPHSAHPKQRGNGPSLSLKGLIATCKSQHRRFPRGRDGADSALEPATPRASTVDASVEGRPAFTLFDVGAGSPRCAHWAAALRVSPSHSQ